MPDLIVILLIAGTGAFGLITLIDGYIIERFYSIMWMCVSLCLLIWLIFASNALVPHNIKEYEISTDNKNQFQYIVSVQNPGRIINITGKFGRIFPENTIIEEYCYGGRWSRGIYFTKMPDPNREFLYRVKEIKGE
jgi:hypothetical protein